MLFFPVGWYFYIPAIPCRTFIFIISGQISGLRTCWYSLFLFDLNLLYRVKSQFLQIHVPQFFLFSLVVRSNAKLHVPLKSIILRKPDVCAHDVHKKTNNNKRVPANRLRITLFIIYDLMSLIYPFTKIGRRTNHNDKSRTKKQ